MPCVPFVPTTFFALYLLIFSYILPFFDGTTSVPRFSDCMLVQINCFCRHVLQHHAFLKMIFHFRTVPPVVVSTHVSFTVMPVRSVQWHYWNYSNIATNIFFFDFQKNCRRDCITCFFEQPHTSHGCSYAGVGIAGGTRDHRRWCFCHSTTVVAGSLPSSFVVFPATSYCLFVHCADPLPAMFL